MHNAHFFETLIWKTDNNLCQKFREINVFTKELTSKLIWRKKFCLVERELLVFSQMKNISQK